MHTNNTSSSRSIKPFTDKAHPLYSLIETLYHLFDCSPPKTVGVCYDCGRGCISKKEAKKLLRGPADQIPTPIIRSWCASATPQPVPKAVLHYLLPRILDGMAAEQHLHYMEQPLRLFSIAGDPDAWTLEQSKALHNFQRQYWRWAAENDTSGGADLTDIFENLLAGGWSAERLWQQLIQWPDDIFLDEAHMGFKHFEQLWEAPVGAILHDRFVQRAAAPGPLQDEAEFLLSVLDYEPPA